MTPERWSEIERICQGALDRSPAERPTYVAEMCCGDDALRCEIETLLAEECRTPGFMSAPAAIEHGHGGRRLIGRRLSAYVITEWLGAGGMGEVYRAHDEHLGRDVAIKVLPDACLGDGARLERFNREARMLAALNHPNIGAIYGLEHLDGVPAIVLELVEGATLAERLDAGPLRVAEALLVAAQILEALDAAHTRGIVHRDLKPSNIKLTPAGGVKVLDFGVARQLGRESAEQHDAVGAGRLTVTADLTKTGTLLGTVGYMSPEQARGLIVDERTDIWAFGCVLYETLTGRAAFADCTAADSMAAILGRDPDWNALPAETPSGVRRVLRRCLERDPASRLHDIADARVDLLEKRGDAPSLTEQRENSLYGRMLALSGRKPYRLWELLQLRIGFLQYPTITFLSWKARSAMPASPGLLLFYAAGLCVLVLLTLRVTLLTTGAIARERLPQQLRRATPWLRTVTVALTLLLSWMALRIGPSHPILAILLGILGAAETLTVAVAEPPIERAAFPEITAETWRGVTP